MHMAILTKRLQILIEQTRFAELEEIAAAEGLTVAALVREALDQVHPRRDLTVQQAGRGLLSREPLDLLSPGEAP